ncbi:MAG: phosphorylase [Pedosphaera sp.]|nr:phosphorylase [Pedosphaera sp.]
MDSKDSILVCFAVKEEAKFFPGISGEKGCERLITGMGQRNAGTSIRKILSTLRPRMVITTGFAGGLNPELKVGTVVFDEDAAAGLSSKLIKLGAKPVKFNCAARVATTVEEKQALWKSSGADVVEMESSVIRQICHEQGIPSATIRVISDAANEDLPLDFNALMTSDERIDFVKLAWKLITGPQKIPQLIRFQKQTVFAARKLANVLNGLLIDGRN